MKIYTDTPEGVTVVKNTFIDQYMPQANGEFVKVYLYLLRCANTGRELSLSSIADVLEHTENDIRRALLYWEKQDLVHLKMNTHGDLISITFSDLPTTQEDVAPEADPLRTSAATAASPELGRVTERMIGYTAAIEVRQKEAAAAKEPEPAAVMSREQLAALSEQKEVRQLFFIAEQYLQRPLNSSEQSEFIYYYDTLKFSPDLIEYLIEYCVSKGTFSRHYMRKIALSWAESGISTVAQARQESSSYNKNYYTILNAFGIKGRSPAAPETELMARWLNDYAFSLEVILEACNRTINQIHQPSFQYADKILQRWKKNKVTSLSDVRRLDQEREEEQQQKQAMKKQDTPQGNRFNNFAQRGYDYTALEKQLLGQHT